MTYNVFGGTLSLTQSINQSTIHSLSHVYLESAYDMDIWTIKEAYWCTVKKLTHHSLSNGLKHTLSPRHTLQKPTSQIGAKNSTPYARTCLMHTGLVADFRSRFLARVSWALIIRNQLLSWTAKGKIVKKYAETSCIENYEWSTCERGLWKSLGFYEKVLVEFCSFLDF